MDALGYIASANLARGLRNYNPGNIKADQVWQGQVGTEGPFVVFANVQWGLRALATDLANKINRGLVTIRQIISTYAPPAENNTAAYIQSVVDDSGFSADQVLPMNSDTLARLMRAIVNHEVGESQSYDYITAADIQQGISMMNDKLLTLFKAAGVAARAIVVDPDGNLQWGRIALIAGGLGVIYYIYKKR